MLKLGHRLKRILWLAIAFGFVCSNARADGVVTGARITCTSASFSDSTGALTLSEWTLFSPCGASVFRNDPLAETFNMYARLDGIIVGPNEGPPFVDIGALSIDFPDEPSDPQGPTFTITEPANFLGQLYGCDANGCGLFTFGSTGTLTVNFTANGPDVYYVSSLTYQFGTVPEPLTLFMLGSGLLAIVFRKFHRRFLPDPV
jgi:PEP-CTERM motif-containing protein